MCLEAFSVAKLLNDDENNEAVTLKAVHLNTLRCAGRHATQSSSSVSGSRSHHLPLISVAKAQTAAISMLSKSQFVCERRGEKKKLDGAK